MNKLINKLIKLKMKQKIKWLFLTNYGRYILAAILSITGVFSENGTIDFLSTDYKIFEYTCASGVILFVCQFLYHVLGAIFTQSKD